MQEGGQASRDLHDSSSELGSSCASHDEDGSSHGSSETEKSDAESEGLDEEDVQDEELADRHDMAASVRFALGRRCKKRMSSF